MTHADAAPACRRVRVAAVGDIHLNASNRGRLRPHLEALAERADLLLWLDLRRLPVMRQVTVRTVRRWWRQELLWNGNVEPPLWTLFTDREHLLRWAWSTHGHTAPRIAALLTGQPELVVVRLADRPAVGRWVAGPLAAAAEG